MEPIKFLADTVNGPVSIEGEMFDLPFGFTGVIHHPLDKVLSLDDEWWVVSELTTGRLLPSKTKKTKKAAIKSARNQVEWIGKDAMAFRISRTQLLNKEE